MVLILFYGQQKQSTFCSNQSVQLRRLSNTLDLQSNRSASFFDDYSQMLKLPTLRAINKSIKYHDLSFATSQGLHKLQKQPQQMQNIQQTSAHHSLLSIRKKYDNLTKIREQVQQKVDYMQKQQQRLSVQKNRFESSKQLGNSTIGDSGNGLEVIKFKLQSAEIEKKIMLHMIERHKWDKIVYDLRKHHQENELAQLRKKIKIMQNQYDKQKAEDDRISKFKYKFLGQLTAEQSERNQYMTIVAGVLEEKSALLQNNETRMEEMKGISESALQGKDYRQKSWYRVYLCQKFVQKLLRDKMNREMMKFNLVQVAFRNIKTSTGINSVDLLVQKYLSKESVYEQLLAKIAQNQKTISHLNSETEHLLRERRKLQTEQETLLSNKRQHQDITREEKQLRQAEQRSNLCSQYVERLENWLGRTLDKFKICQENQQQTSSNLPKIDIVGLFKKYQAVLFKSKDKIVNSQENDKHLEVVQHQNNFRIIWGDTGQNEEKHLKTTNLDEQQEYVNTQRLDMIQKNDKYRKQLRKKHEDLKKAQIEAELKKRQFISQGPRIQKAQS